VIHRVGERWALIVGLACGVAGFAVFGLSATGYGFWSGIPLLALWGLASPASLGLMSRHVGASEQGQLQGANSSLMGIASLFGPGLFTQTFAPAIGPWRDWNLPGAPFLLAALLLVAAALLAWRTTRR
jgi:DHA1 family tetracycline resistance protein-like MFS transporter